MIAAGKYMSIRFGPYFAFLIPSKEDMEEGNNDYSGKSTACRGQSDV